MTDRRRRPRSGDKSRSRPISGNPFRERRGPGLRGFAVLVALGDQQTAERALERALDDGERRDAARPIERPAGWLRRRVIQHLGEPPRPLARWLATDAALLEERRATLRALGASDAVIGGLGALGAFDRGLVVAHQIEHLAMPELQAILGREDAATQRRVSRALRGYLNGAARLMAEEPWARREPSGPVSRLLASVAPETGVSGEGRS